MRLMLNGHSHYQITKDGRGVVQLACGPNLLTVYLCSKVVSYLHYRRISVSEDMGFLAGQLRTLQKIIVKNIY